jgi:hypothetical protein
LAMALQMHEDRNKPAFVRPPPGGAAAAPKVDAPPERRKETLPDFERDRRRDPVAYASQLNGSVPQKPKFALVADFVGSDTGTIHRELGELADMRYLDAPAKLQGLRQFNANAGRIVLWADHAPHDWERAMKAMGVSYRVHRGSLPSLVQSIKDAVQKR